MNSFTITAPTLAFVLAAVGNLVALVWGAAKVSSAVDRLSTWADKADHKIDDHESRISTLEGAQR